MESAIPEHLLCPRTRERRIPDDYAPPYPAWVARHPSSVSQVVMAYYGVQYRDAGHTAAACAALRQFLDAAAGGDPELRPGHHDIARYRDEAGYDTLMLIAYWDDPARHHRWWAQPALQRWWGRDDRLAGPVGLFREVVCPPVQRYETLFSTPDRFEGVAVTASGLSGDVQEHAYWGGMRDRIPLSQTDPMKPEGRLGVVGGWKPGARVGVVPAHNVAMIRSGQEWTDTVDRERTLYLEQMEPVLREGMDYLRDRGVPIGCFTNRYMTHLGADGQPQQKSFGLSYWRSLADMERWSESHPTHVAIFGTFMRIVQELNFDLKLRLYHEVSVLTAEQQQFEYLNCHPKTGLLNGVAV